MSLSISDSMNQLLDRFDETWNEPTPPRIEDYLAKADPNKRFSLLIELVRIDLEHRLIAGEKARLEELYLPRFPELFAELPTLVTLVKHEYAVRRRNEPELMPSEYLERFPQCRTELLAQLPTLDDIRDGQWQQQTADAQAGLDPRGYELIETLGKGGMGEVYRCIDPALGRDLAIKVMKAEFGGRVEAERRFLREARVTSSLQHPGIVPIHNLGRLADGRLHYTMRLVRGQTFADILQQEAGKPERLPYLLSIFEKICQAVAYAHNKRVLHRDLKPQNVMVGRFGEVQVMDWGLAKMLTPGERGCVSAPSTEDAAGSRIVTEADTPSDLSRMGSGMGTPAYMPPEQALGEWEAVDERADVFDLGSILCDILTGQPVYSGTDGEEVYRRAKRGDVAEAMQRLQQCGSDEALTALCRECLSPNREDRPRDATTVAKRVAEYQAEVQERLRRAEVERAEAQLKAREGRKQRRLLIALVLALLAGAALISWQAARATLAEAAAHESASQALAERDDKVIALGRAEAAADAERNAKEAEAAQRKQAEESEADTKAVLAFFNDKVLSAGRPVGQEGGLGLDVKLRQAVERAERDVAKSFPDRPLVEASVRDTLGGTYWYLGDYPQAIRQHERALALRTEKLGPGHADTLTSRNNLALAYWSFGRTAEAIPLHEQNLKQMEAKLGPDHPDTLKSRNNLALAYQSAGRTIEAIPLHEQNLKQMEAKLGPDHPEALRSRNGLATSYWSVGRSAEAIRLFERILKQREAKLGTDHPDTLVSRNNLALAYLRTGRTAEAIRLHEQNLKQVEAKLGPDHPSTLLSRNNLATAYQSTGRTTEAIRLHEQNLKQREAKFGIDHLDTLVSRNNLAAAYKSAGRIVQAIRLHEQNLKQREARLGTDHPDTLQSMADLGGCYRDAGRLQDAIPLLEESLERGRARPGGLPAGLALIPLSLAETYDRAGKLTKSEQLYRDVLDEWRKRFGSEDPRTAGLMAMLGSNLMHQHKYTDAEPLLRDCLKVRETKQPDDWTTFNARSLLGAALLGQKKYIEAEPLLLQGYEGMKAREAKVPPQSRIGLTEALERLVQLYEATDQKIKAADWRKKLQQTKDVKKNPKR